MRSKLAGPAVVALVLVVAAGGWLAWPRLFPDPLAEGRAAYERGDWGASASAARAILRESPGEVEALRLLARSSARLGRDAAAQGMFGRLGDRLEAEDYLLLANGLIRQGRPEPALAVLRKARAVDPGHAETLRELARLEARLRHLDEAEAAARELAALPGWEARGSVVVGLLRLERHDPDGAAEALGRAVRLDPDLNGADADPAAIRKALARARLQLGQADEAEAALRPLADDPEVAWLRSRAALQAGRIEVAARNLDLAEDYGKDDPTHPEPAPYLGAASCAGCHPNEYRAEQSSRHARTLFRPEELRRDLPLPRRSLPDPADPGVRHTFRREGDRIVVETSADAETARAVVEYALGSGDRGLTLLARDDRGTPRVVRMSLYKDRSTWDITPSMPAHPDNPHEWLGRPLSESGLHECIDCHLTSPRAARSAEFPEAADRGIGCERCHGPGGNHVRAVEAKFPDLAIARPSLAEAAGINALCARCHDPDDPDLSPDDPRFVRFQTSTLVQSPCYTQSQGGLSCLTCHNPHRDATDNAAFYESKCLSCHSHSPAPSVASPGPTRPARLPDGMTPVECPVNSTGDCLKCHMPTVRDVAPHTAFTDHHIRVHREATAE